MTTDRAPNTRAEEAAAVWSAAPKQFDKALLKVIACWDDALQRMRPDNEHAFVALMMHVRQPHVFAGDMGNAEMWRLRIPIQTPSMKREITFWGRCGGRGGDNGEDTHDERCTLLLRCVGELHHGVEDLYPSARVDVERALALRELR